MNFVQSEEKTKAAKLIFAILAVFGFGAWRVAGAMEPPAKSAAPTAPVSGAAETGGSAPTPAPSPETAPKDDAIPLPTVAVASNLNPFREIAAAPDEQIAAPPAGGAPSPSPTISGTLPTGPSPAGSLPGGPSPSAPLSVAPLPTQTGSSLAPPVARTPLRVTGIVAGRNGTAVLDLGGETRVVRVGARLPDGTVVLRIDPSTVTVRQGGQTKTLDVGE